MPSNITCNKIGNFALIRKNNDKIIKKNINNLNETNTFNNFFNIYKYLEFIY